MRWTSVLLCAVLLGLPRAGWSQATGAISGTVSSDAGAPLSGASVTVVGTGAAALTGPDGRYTLEGVPAGTHTVRATMLGYGEATQTVTVQAGATATANLTLSAAAVELEGIVAIGYGTTSQRNLTGAVASVSGEDVLTEATPVTAVSNALQGKAPGVQVVTNSGVPGAGSSVRIRGTNSISANSEPLYVIDGIPAVQGTNSEDPTYNPLNEINPNDIESIQILKDASATAIYGSRAANGVILITTKRGQSGADQVRVETSYGWQEISKTINPLTAPQYMELVNEAYTNIGREPRYTQEQIASAQTYNYVDLMTQRAPQQSHSITLTGGDERTRYLISGNYVDQEGILVNTGFERYGLRFNLDRNMSSRFRTGTSLSFARVHQAINRSENGGIGASARGILAAINFDPSLAPKDEDGNWNKRAVLGEQLENPLANMMEIVDVRNEYRGIGNVYAEYDLLDNLVLKTTAGINAHFWRNPYFAPSTIAPGDGANGVAAMGDGYDRQLTSENTATYRREVGAGSLEVLGGFSVQTYQSESSWSEGQGFPTDEIAWHDLGAGAGNRGVDTGYSDWTLISTLGRINYNLLDRYLFTLTGRRDGSSRFGANNKWAFFPSAAFAWRIVDEPFMQDQTLFDELKLRLSYGVTGSQAVAQYQSLSRLSTEFVGIGINDEVVTLRPSSSAPNPDLKWEKQQQFNVGLDMAFLDNRIALTLDAYRSTTSDLLLWVDLPRTSGYVNQLRNLGEVENRGFEVGLSTVNVTTPSFNWRSTLNVSVNRNEVTDLGGVDYIYPGGSRYGWFLDGGQSHIVKVGEPLGTFYGYETDGLWQEGDECYLNNSDECTPGEYKLVDQNGDGVINADDRTILGYADPDFYGGFSNNFTWGPVRLDAFFTFSYGNEVANVSRVFTESATGFLNESERVLDRWTPENTDTDIPRANNARPRRLYGAYIEDGSYLRLSNLTLGYQLPERLLPGVSSAELYLTGQNLFVLTDYTGFDPEVNSIGGDSRLRGVDSGAYPRARTWNIGANITF
ncbi:MAG TPA: TonB-dependent receptor [Longimicrobiaceae bacterium]